MSIADQIYAIVKALPPEQASEVLTFAEFVQAKHQNHEQPQEPQDEASWKELVRSLGGAWADFPTLEEIRSDLGQDVPRESL